MAKFVEQGFEDEFGCWHNCPDWCLVCGSCDGPPPCSKHMGGVDLFGVVMMRELEKVCLDMERRE